MIYDAFSLNGSWEMNYTYEPYLGETNPWKGGYCIENAVPGYWEDMTDAFQMAPFHRFLHVNPAYGLQRYPMVEAAPDMALPNVEGNFFYMRSFIWEEATANTVLHFEGVQNAVSAWLNGVYLGRHEGYSTPFDMEIPVRALKEGANELVLSVSNHMLSGFDGEPVSGLTSRAVNKCTGGITGDIELRVYNSPLRDVVILVAGDCETISVSAVFEDDACHPITWSVYDGGSLLKHGKAEGVFHFDTADLDRWSPEHPKRYVLEICCGVGSLRREFGVRRLRPLETGFLLNGIPYYLRGICEHCYYPDTVHPPHDIVFYRNVIKTIKNLGFNFIRFHTHIPPEEYMQAADELGILLQVESPNNTTAQEYAEIVKFCRRHPSAVIYCCGNELQVDDTFEVYLKECADLVHANTDSLFSPLSALRGLEYVFEDDNPEELSQEPFTHNPRRFRDVGAFSDLYSSFSLGHFSYESMTAEPEKVSDWHCVYRKPRVTHEICIDSTYIDLSLEERYQNSRIGHTQMFSSIRAHLEQKGLLQKAPLFFRNSCEWQRRVRKHCFEAVRKCVKLAGYDFLGPIDTHWHTFGYDVGMMNEFYEMKPGENIRNVRMYNAPTVLLTDLDTDVNFTAGKPLSFQIFMSHYGSGDIQNGTLSVRLTLGEKVLHRWTERIEHVQNGTLSSRFDFSVVLPELKKPEAMKLYACLDYGEHFTENEWELYVFPDAEASQEENDKTGNCMIVTGGISAEELLEMLKLGKDVVIFGSTPFANKDTSFRIGMPGRVFGNLATVLYDHPVLKDMPHEGFCGWQFKGLMTGGSAVCFESDNVAFDPIIEVASTPKCAVKQAAMFEFSALNGRIFVCSLHFGGNDPAAAWLKHQILAYVGSEEFQPKHSLNEEQFASLTHGHTLKVTTNTNRAMNLNDITALKRRKVVHNFGK